MDKSGIIFCMLLDALLLKEATAWGILKRLAAAGSTAEADTDGADTVPPVATDASPDAGFAPVAAARIAG